MKLSILIAAAVIAAPAAAAPAEQGPTRERASAPRCSQQPCVPRIPASCLIDPSRPAARVCQHSASDVEKLGRWQLDQLIASLN